MEDSSQKIGEFALGGLSALAFFIPSAVLRLLECVQGADLSRPYTNHQPCVVHFDQHDALTLADRDAAHYLEQIARSLLRHIHALEQPCNQHYGGQHQEQAEDDLYDAAGTDCGWRGSVCGACSFYCSRPNR